MADDFTCLLRNKFKRFIEELPYEEMRQSIFTEELEVADPVTCPFRKDLTRICYLYFNKFDILRNKFYILQQVLYIL